MEEQDPNNHHHRQEEQSMFATNADIVFYSITFVLAIVFPPLAVFLRVKRVTSNWTIIWVNVLVCTALCLVFWVPGVLFATCIACVGEVPLMIPIPDDEENEDDSIFGTNEDEDNNNNKNQDKSLRKASNGIELRMVTPPDDDELKQQQEEEQHLSDDEEYELKIKQQMEQRHMNRDIMHGDDHQYV